MKLLRQIFIAIALLIAAMPCTHAAGHEQHQHGEKANAEICSTHACACHSGGDTPCSDGVNISQNTTTVSAAVEAPASAVLLFVFTESKPVIKQVLSPAGGTLAALQTIQLLI